MNYDQDLQSRQEARSLLREAEAAQKTLAAMSQQQIDAIVEAMAKAFLENAEMLGQMAWEETGFGNPRDKARKNRFASGRVLEATKNMKTVGVLNEAQGGKLWEIAVPVGVICGIVPSTNPTSTVCYNAMIAVKAGNAIVFSPHPKAVRSTGKAAQIVAKAAEAAGAPRGTVGCVTIASMAGCQELMTAPETRLILATGGPGMVKAAYSSGKPAIGVGAGNGPCYIHRSADVKQALGCVLESKTFDCGTVCASEQSIVVEKSMERTVMDTAKGMGFRFLSTEEAGKLAKLLFRPDGSLNPAIVGKSAGKLAEMAGISVAEDTRILVAREQEAGPTRPYSREKLCPVLAFFVMEDEDAVLQKAIEVLSFEGSGHTFVMHAREEGVVRKFSRHIPVSRFLVNTPAAMGGIGMTTPLFPALTLGCGAVGGSSSSNNISPMDLLNIRRVAWGTEEPAPQSVDPALLEAITAKILERLK